MNYLSIPVLLRRERGDEGLRDVGVGLGIGGKL